MLKNKQYFVETPLNGLRLSFIQCTYLDLNFYIFIHKAVWNHEIRSFIVKITPDIQIQNWENFSILKKISEIYKNDSFIDQILCCFYWLSLNQQLYLTLRCLTYVKQIHFTNEVIPRMMCVPPNVCTVFASICIIWLALVPVRVSDRLYWF